MLKKCFRVQHEKSYGLNPVHLMQNRIIVAENAEQALRIAMRNTDNNSIEVRSESLALADRSSPKTCFDYWKAELESRHAD